MTLEIVEAHWIEARGDYTTRDLADLSGLPMTAIETLVAHGALPAAPTHAAESVVLVRRVRRLQEAFELDDNGLAVALTLLRRLQVVEREVEAMRANAG